MSQKDGTDSTEYFVLNELGTYTHPSLAGRFFPFPKKEKSYSNYYYIFSVGIFLFGPGQKGPS